MHKKSDLSQKKHVVEDWVGNEFFHPLKQIAGDLTVLVIFTGVSVLVGTTSLVQLIKNRITS